MCKSWEKSVSLLRFYSETDIIYIYNDNTKILWERDRYNL